MRSVGTILDTPSAFAIGRGRITVAFLKKGVEDVAAKDGDGGDQSKGG